MGRGAYDITLFAVRGLGDSTSGIEGPSNRDQPDAPVLATTDIEPDPAMRGSGTEELLFTNEATWDANLTILTAAVPASEVKSTLRHARMEPSPDEDCYEAHRLASGCTQSAKTAESTAMVCSPTCIVSR